MARVNGGSGGMLLAHCDRRVLPVSSPSLSSHPLSSDAMCRLVPSVNMVSAGQLLKQSPKVLGGACRRAGWGSGSTVPPFLRSNRETLLRVAQDGRVGHSHTRHKAYRVLAINSSSSRCVLQRHSFCNYKSDILMDYADQLRL